ncbi:ATP-binding cassette domain-containing protein [Sandarakinorhabdus sp.]|uniref:ATP-binding cassette domain-containing protein n=1 Tax=Sandarakinorhabdus sp. TaxID=1916663 RepID=UPI00286E37BF|nr:ATP-binding cassette domain-containing protein [Sandarakinorhabdus sp.]
MPGSPFLCLDDVSLLRGEQQVLDGVSLAVPAGQFTALVGASGAGKTTLLRIINRMNRPDRGTVLLDGTDIAAIDPVTLRRGMGYAVQGAGLFPHWTVAENIAAVPWMMGWDKAQTAARVDDLLDMLELPRSLAGRWPAQLSGGQASRVGLARALAARPRLLLLDEPFGALDPDTRMALGDRLEALHRAEGLTTLLVTHDLADALLRADRIVVMDRGRIAADGSPHDIATSAHPAVETLIAAPMDQARRLAAL